MGLLTPKDIHSLKDSLRSGLLSKRGFNLLVMNEGTRFFRLSSDSSATIFTD